MGTHESPELKKKTLRHSRLFKIHTSGDLKLTANILNACGLKKHRDSDTPCAHMYLLACQYNLTFFHFGIIFDNEMSITTNKQAFCLRC